MAWAGEVFGGLHLTFEDDRRDYGETRFFTIGFLDGRMVYFAWTWRDDVARIITMRKTNEREQLKYGRYIGNGAG